MRSLLGHRDAGSTICPSDAARVVAGDGFRAVMDDARRVAAGLRAAGVVVTTQGGMDVDPEGARGPIRIGRGSHWDARHTARPAESRPAPVRHSHLPGHLEGAAEGWTTCHDRTRRQVS